MFPCNTKYRKHHFEANEISLSLHLYKNALPVSRHQVPSQGAPPTRLYSCSLDDGRRNTMQQSKAKPPARGQRFVTTKSPSLLTGYASS